MKQEDRTQCEAFEVSPNKDLVGKTPDPGLAVETPNGVFDDEDFRFELARFLSVNSNLPLLPPAHPQYQLELAA